MTPLISERSFVAGVTPTIINKVLTEANTEYAISLPSGCRKFGMKARNMDNIVKLAFTEGKSGSEYITLDSGSYSEDGVLALNTILYVQSPTAGAVVELIAWS